MFDLGHYGTMRPHKGYFQVEMSLDETHQANIAEDPFWESDPVADANTAMEIVNKKSESILQRVEGGKLAEMEAEEDGDFPTIFVVDKENVAVAAFCVNFIDYSDETIQ